MVGGSRCAVLIAGLVAPSMVACSTTATISRTNGPDVDVHFAGSDESNIYVKTGLGTHAIPKKDVTDIDHPGDGALVIGTLLASYGVVNIAVGYPQCSKPSQNNQAAYCIGVFTPAVLGVVMMGWGIAVHVESEQELERKVYRSNRGGRAMFVPLLFNQDNTRMGGLGWVATW